MLMLAYMNEESLKKTLETGYTWFFSRSRQKLWQKGETSGNVQKVKEISYDCDGDTLLVRVHQTGVACHTGTYTCFSGRKLMGGEEKGVAVVPPAKKADLAAVLYDLYNVLEEQRVQGDPLRDGRPLVSLPRSARLPQHLPRGALRRAHVPQEGRELPQVYRQDRRAPRPLIASDSLPVVYWTEFAKTLGFSEGFFVDRMSR